MSTETATATTTAPAHGGTHRPQHHLTFLRILSSEWIKFTTLRSTWILLATTIVVMIGIGLLGGWGIGSAMEEIKASGQDPATVGLDPGMLYGTPLFGLDFGQLIIGSLGVLMIASEYSTGMIRSTMTAVPTRLPAFLGKALVVAVVAALVGIVSSFATYFLLQPILAQYEAGFELGVENLTQSMLLAGVYLALASVMALGLGALLRNSAGAIVTLVALFLVLPTVLGFIQFDWVQDGVIPFLPGNAGHQMLLLQTPEDTLTQTQGGLVLGAWAAGLLALGAASLKARDV